MIPNKTPNLKKEIANVNIGLLEKGVTTAQKPVLFKDLRGSTDVSTYVWRSG